MKEDLQKLLEFVQERAEKAEQKMYDLEPRFEDGEREAFEKYNYWEGALNCAELIIDKIKTLL